MAIPDYQVFMLPLLEAIADGREYRIGEVVQLLADHFGISQSEREMLLPSGQQTILANRVAWSKTYLKKAGLIDNSTRGRVRITAEGLKVVKERPPIVDKNFLRKYSAFNEFLQLQNDDDGVAPENVATDAKTPEEAIEDAYGALRSALADDLLEKVKACTPTFFEQLVVRLLVAMGYGGTLRDAGQAVGRSGDGGIDGIIKEDMLGLDVVCIQAKRWEQPVGRPAVQAFVGSMEGFRARKGVLITSSSFSKEAEEYVGKIERKIVLITGKQLAQYMIDYDIGVTAARSFTIKRADSDFFIEEE